MIYFLDGSLFIHFSDSMSLFLLRLFLLYTCVLDEKLQDYKLYKLEYKLDLGIFRANRQDLPIIYSFLFYVLLRERNHLRAAIAGVLCYSSFFTIGFEDFSNVDSQSISTKISGTCAYITNFSSSIDKLFSSFILFA